MKIVITGANGQLGLAFRRLFAQKGIPFLNTDIATCNIAKKDQVETMLDASRPSVLINCAAYNQVDEAEDDRTAAFEVNAQAVAILARACQSRGIKFVHYSSDYVFDGKKGSLYVEEDAANPLNVYGLSKYEGEIALRNIGGNHLVFRTSWVYGEGKQNFLYKVAQWAQKSSAIKVSDDEISAPTSADDIAAVTLKSLERGLTGLYHLTGSGYVSRFEWAKAYLKACGSAAQVIGVPMSFFSLKALRPHFSAMSNQKISNKLAIEIPSWQEALEKYVRYQN